MSSILLCITSNISVTQGLGWFDSPKLQLLPLLGQPKLFRLLSPRSFYLPRFSSVFFSIEEMANVQVEEGTSKNCTWLSALLFLLVSGCLGSHMLYSEGCFLSFSRLQWWKRQSSLPFSINWKLNCYWTLEKIHYDVILFCFVFLILLPLTQTKLVLWYSPQLFIP